jgi:hypothetical protein
MENLDQTTRRNGSRRTEIRRAVAASVVGTAVEWYDFFAYGVAAALVFNQLFFPTFDPLVGTLAAFATCSIRGRGSSVGACICRRPQAWGWGSPRRPSGGMRSTEPRKGVRAR